MGVEKKMLPDGDSGGEEKYEMDEASKKNRNYHN